MRTSLIVGWVAFLGLASSSVACASDDHEAPSAAGASGTAQAGGTGGGTGSGGSNDASGGTDTASGGTANGDAGASGAGGSSSDGGTANGNAGAPSDDVNAGASGASDGVPYANVVAVKIVSGSEGAYTFSVSVESADIDCTQYANWWEVLTEDGALSYRRIIDHSHTDANGASDPDKPGNTFTRTGGPVPIAADTVVLVRAHMSTGGYNGSVMRGSATAEFVQAPDIGADFAADVETLEPQATSCTF